MPSTFTQPSGTKIIIQQGQGSSSYQSEGESSRQGSHEYPTEEDDWEDEEDIYDDEDILPSDSASASNETAALRTRPPRQAQRRHRLRRHPIYSAPNPPPIVAHHDEYNSYGRGGYHHQAPGMYYRGPPPGHQYAQSQHHAAPYMGGYAANSQMVPLAQYGPSPSFSPLSNTSSGLSYFGGEQQRGMYDMMAYHQNPPQNQAYWAAQHHQLPSYMQQFHLTGPHPAPTEVPNPPATPAPKESDPEKQELERQLALLKAQEEKKREEEEQKKLEAKIREDAERAFQQRMEDMRRVQEETKKEIERAKAEAERAERERIETQRRAEEERNKQHAEAMARAEENARKKFEAEMKAAEERRLKEEEDRKRAEEAARTRLEAAIKAEAEAKAAAEKKAAEEAERLKQIQEDAKRTAEAEARAKLAKEQADAKAAADAEEAAKKEAEDTKKRIQEETMAKYDEDMKKKRDKQPIRFTDAVGRKFSFPFHLCATWEGMKELINQAFQQVDVLGPHVRAGHYDLIGPNNEIILPEVWNQVIEPDWTIKMTMWPMDKSPPLKHAHLNPQMPAHGIGRGGRFGVPAGGVPRMPQYPLGGGGFDGIPVPPVPPAGPRWSTVGSVPTMPHGVNIVDAQPARKTSKGKSKAGVVNFFMGSKPAKKRSHRK